MTQIRQTNWATNIMRRIFSFFSFRTVGGAWRSLILLMIVFVFASRGLILDHIWAPFLSLSLIPLLILCGFIVYSLFTRRSMSGDWNAFERSAGDVWRWFNENSGRVVMLWAVILGLLFGMDAILFQSSLLVSFRKGAKEIFEIIFQIIVILVIAQAVWIGLIHKPKKKKGGH